MKSVLITGSNRGLGLGMIKYILSRKTQPSHVIATCRKPEQAKELNELSQSHNNLHILKLDLLDLNSYANVTKEISNITKEDGINLLINNGGVTSKFTTLNFVKAEQLVENFTVNTLAPIMLTKNILPLLKIASKKCSDAEMSINRAAIVNMSSILGSVAANDKGGFYPYRCSKTALNAATRSMSVDLKKDRILVISLHPGWVKTDMGGQHAPLEIETSINGMFETLATFNEEHSGNFYQYDGQKLDW